MVYVCVCACIAFASDNIVSGASIICPLVLKEYVMCVCACERGRERESGRVHSNGNCVKACDRTKWCVCIGMCVCVCVRYHIEGRKYERIYSRAYVHVKNNGNAVQCGECNVY